MTRRTTCALDDCHSPWFCNDWCERHYRRWLRTGNPHGRRGSRKIRTVPAHELARLRRLVGLPTEGPDRAWHHTQAALETTS